MNSDQSSSYSRQACHYPSKGHAIGSPHAEHNAGLQLCWWPAIIRQIDYSDLPSNHEQYPEIKSWNSAYINL